MHLYISNFLRSLTPFEDKIPPEEWSSFQQDLKELDAYLIQLQETSHFAHLYREVVPVPSKPVPQIEFKEKCFCPQEINRCWTHFFSFIRCPDRYKKLTSLLQLALAQDYIIYFRKPSVIEFQPSELILGPWEEEIETQLGLFETILPHLRREESKCYAYIDFFNCMVSNFSFILHSEKYRHLFLSQLKKLESEFKPLLHIETNPFSKWKELNLYLEEK